MPLIPSGPLIFYLQILYWFWSDCVKLWHDLSLQFPCLGLSQHLCLSALERLINGFAGAFIAMSHLWIYDWLLASSEIGNALCCDCFVKHLHNIYYKGQIALVLSSKNIWSQSTSETVSFRHTFILGCHYRVEPQHSALEMVSFIWFFFQQWWYSDVCLYRSSMPFHFVISTLLIKLSYLIFCISFLITALFDYLSLTLTSVWLGSIADYQRRKMCVKAYKASSWSLKHVKLCEQIIFSTFPQSDHAPEIYNVTVSIVFNQKICNNVLYTHMCLIWSIYLSSYTKSYKNNKCIQV